MPVISLSSKVVLIFARGEVDSLSIDSRRSLCALDGFEMDSRSMNSIWILEVLLIEWIRIIAFVWFNKHRS